MSSQLASQPTIPADWIANELSLPPITVLEWADRLCLTYHRDDSGREWIAESDGRRIIEEVRRAGREAAELHEAYQRYLDEWDQQRRQAGEDVYQRVLLEEYNRQLAARMPADFAFVGGRERLGPGPQARAFANSEAQAARVAWERKHPQQTFDQFERKWRKGRR